MTDPTAAERAREVVLRAICDPGLRVTREPPDGRHSRLVLWQAKAVLTDLLANPSLLAALAVEAGGMGDAAVTGTVVDAIHFAKPQTPEDVEHVVLHVQVPEGEYEWLLDSQVDLFRRVEGDRDE